MNYVVASKTDYSDRSGNQGKQILMSFAQAPLWKTFKYIHWQNDTIPNCYDKRTATYALNKYANSKEFEVVSYDKVQKEFKAYIDTL